MSDEQVQNDRDNNFTSGEILNQKNLRKKRKGFNPIDKQDPTGPVVV